MRMLSVCQLPGNGRRVARDSHSRDHAQNPGRLPSWISNNPAVKKARRRDFWAASLAVQLAYQMFWLAVSNGEPISNEKRSQIDNWYDRKSGKPMVRKAIPLHITRKIKSSMKRNLDSRSYQMGGRTSKRLPRWLTDLIESDLQSPDQEAAIRMSDHDAENPDNQMDVNSIYRMASLLRRIRKSGSKGISVRTTLSDENLSDLEILMARKLVRVISGNPAPRIVATAIVFQACGLPEDD